MLPFSLPRLGPVRGCTCIQVHPGGWFAWPYVTCRATVKEYPPRQHAAVYTNGNPQKEKARTCWIFPRNLEKRSPIYPSGYFGALHRRTLRYATGFLNGCCVGGSIYWIREGMLCSTVFGGISAGESVTFHQKAVANRFCQKTQEMGTGGHRAGGGGQRSVDT